MRKQRERFVKIRNAENKVHSRKQLLFTTLSPVKGKASVLRNQFHQIVANSFRQLQIEMSCEALQFWIISSLKSFAENPKWRIALRSLHLLENGNKENSNNENQKSGEKNSKKNFFTLFNLHFFIYLHYKKKVRAVEPS